MGCLSGHQSQCGSGAGYEALGGWRLGNTDNGAQAEFSQRIDLTPLITHRFNLDEIEEAYALFSDRRDGVIKVAIRP
jgi:threonine dehydrogenase-like Zn-dependent dehydrogenase